MRLCQVLGLLSQTEQIESDFILQKNATFILAPQELVDCDANGDERDGCHGGNPTTAYNVIQSLGGMELEPDYPYTAKNQPCGFKKSFDNDSFLQLDRNQDGMISLDEWIDGMLKLTRRTGDEEFEADAARWLSNLSKNQRRVCCMEMPFAAMKASFICVL